MLCGVTAPVAFAFGILGIRDSKRTGSGRGPSLAAIVISGIVMVGLGAATVSLWGTAEDQPPTATAEESGEASRPTPSASQDRTRSALVGTVTGYSEDNESVVVDGTKYIELDLISVVSRDDCDATSIDWKDKAVQAKKTLLPVGQRVLIAWSEPPTTKYGLEAEDGLEGIGFLHLLPETSDIPEVAPPRSSANELLVRTGYWMPDDFGISDPGEYSKATYKLSKDRYMTPVQNKYAPYLVKAGNSARKTKSGNYEKCFGPFATRQEETAWYAAEADRIVAEGEAEAERDRKNRPPGPPVYCRDGDGDGICFED
jgi:hypothetical protein